MVIPGVLWMIESLHDEERQQMVAFGFLMAVMAGLMIHASRYDVRQVPQAQAYASEYYEADDDSRYEAENDPRQPGNRGAGVHINAEGEVVVSEEARYEYLKHLSEGVL